MRSLLAICFFAASSVFGQTVTTTFLIQADLGNNRTAIVQTTVVYPDSLEIEQYPDLVTVATEVSNHLRNYPNKGAVALEALAVGTAKFAMEKFPVATGSTVLFSLGSSGSTQITATRIAPKAPPAEQTAAMAAIREIQRSARGSAQLK